MYKVKPLKILVGIIALQCHCNKHSVSAFNTCMHTKVMGTGAPRDIQGFWQFVTKNTTLHASMQLTINPDWALS